MVVVVVGGGVNVVVGAGAVVVVAGTVMAVAGGAASERGKVVEPASPLQDVSVKASNATTVGRYMGVTLTPTTVRSLPLVEV